MKPAWLHFPPPLRISIPILVFAFSLVYDVTNTWVLMSGETRREYERVQNTALAQASRLTDAMENFRAGEPSGDNPVLAWELKKLGEDNKVQYALVCDENLVIRHATTAAWVGQSLPMLRISAGLEGVVQEAVGSGRSSAATLSRKRVLAAWPASPGVERSAPWVSVVARDPSAAVKAEQWESIYEGLISALLHLAACAGLWWVLHRFLSRRVDQLLDSTRHLTVEGVKPQPLSGRDEFAQIVAALREGENIFQQLVENIRDCIYLFSGDRERILYVSPSYEEMWGRPVPATGLSPQMFLDFVVEEDKEMMSRLLEPLADDKKIVQAEFRIQHPDGSLRWLETRAFPVMNDQGKMHRIAGITIDVTSRKLLEQEVLEAGERERRRIGHDLHDDLCQRLAAVKLVSEMLLDKIKNGRMEEARQMVKTSSRQIGEAATLARNLARGLSPVNLEGEGFIHALAKLVETCKDLYRVPITFERPDAVSISNPTTATHLYRIAQELINNAARHANPTYIHVKLAVEGARLSLSVTNDGASFVDSPRDKEGGMGLRIIHYRANAIGASIQFFEREGPESGTRAVCQVPLVYGNGPMTKDEK